MIAAIKGAFMIARGVWICAAVAMLSVLTVAFAIGLSSGAIAAPGDTVRVSEASDGTQGNSFTSGTVNISSTGRFVVFPSAASNLVPGDSNGKLDVFLRDRDTDVDGMFDEPGAVGTERVSVSSTGTEGDANSNDFPAVSADGRYVSFGSDATNLVAGDTNGQRDIFVRDRVANSTVRVSVSSGDVQANDDSSAESDISGDGRFVAFCSDASNLVAGDTNGWPDAFLRDRDTDENGIYDEPGNVSTTKISFSTIGGPSNRYVCSTTVDRGIAISGNGQFVAYSSDASNLVASDTNNTFDVFVYSRLTVTIERVSISSGGAEAHGVVPDISDDGRFVVFQSSANNFVANDNNGVDIFLRDRTLGTTERVSVGAGGTEANGNSVLATVNDDGRYVTFESIAYNLAAPDSNDLADVFVRDRQLGSTEMISVDSSGNEACNALSSQRPSISGDGLHVAFTSTEPNLVPGDTNGTRDVFTHERGGSIGSSCGPTPTPLPMSGVGSAFSPTTNVKLCNGLPPAGFGDGSVSGNPSCADATNDGVTFTNTLPSGNVNFSSQVTFVPNNGTPGIGSAGTLGGGVRITGSFGVSNAPCNVSLDEDFVLYNVALPDNPGNPRSSTNIVYPMAIGTPDRFSKWKVGSAPTGADPTGIDTGGDPDYAVGTSLAFQNYPSYLLDALDPDFVPGVSDGPALPIVPQAVYGALTNFGGQWRPLFLGKLAPSTMPSFTAPFPAGVAAKPAMGSPLMWVGGDPTDYVPTPDNLTDSCSPSVTTITLTGSTSMATGTNYYLQYLTSLRDIDQDSFENAIDTCPVNVNAGSPRVALSGDADNDGIDDVCDPSNPTPAAVADFDGDGFQNRGDNCALVANSSQVQSERSPAADKGPIADNIGDACDSESGLRNLYQNGVITTITLSDTVANGRYMTVTNVVAKCVGQADADGDGYCTAQDTGADSGTCTTQTPPSCTSRHLQWAGATFPALQMDTDSDKVADALETYVGTDSVQSCSANSTANNEPMDNWMFDLNDNFTVSGHDTGPYGGAGGGFGKNVVNGPYNGRPGVRYDFNVDGIINGQDTAKFGGVGPYGGTGPFNKSCPPGAGTPVGIPPFYQQ